MNHLDLVTSIFSAGGAVCLFFHCYALLRDKDVKGVSFVPVWWWFAWGVWNLYYYSALNQPWSFYTSILVLVLTIVRLCLMIHYKRREASL
jgi:hypothetical protein